VLATAGQLREEAEVLDRIVGEVAGQMGARADPCLPSMPHAFASWSRVAPARSAASGGGGGPAAGPASRGPGEGDRGPRPLAAESAALDIGGGSASSPSTGCWRFQRDEDQAPRARPYCRCRAIAVSGLGPALRGHPGDEAHDELGSTDEPVLDARSWRRR
jgi:hypothetical protein